MATWRRVLLALVLATAGLVAFAWLVVRSEEGTRQLCALAESLIRDAARERVVIGRCDVSGFAQRVSLEGVEIGPAERPLLSAEAIRADVDRNAAAAGLLRLEKLEVVRPRLDLDLTGPLGQERVSETTPRRTGAGSCLPEPGLVELGAVEVTGADVSLALPEGIRAEVRGGNLRVVQRQSLLDGSLAVARTTYRDAERDVVVERATSEGALDLATGEATLRRLDLGAPEGSVYLREARVRDVCRPTGQLTARVRLDLEALGRNLLREVPGLGGALEATVRLDLTPGAWKSSANGTVKDATIDNFRPGDFSFSLSATPTGAVIDSLQVPLGEGRATISGDVSFLPPNRMRAEAKLDKVALGEVLRRLDAPDLTTHLVASGTARLEGPLTGTRGPRLEGSVDASIPEFGVFNRKWHERALATRRWVGFSDGMLHAEFVVGRDAVTIQRAMAQVDDTVAEVSGRVSYIYREGLALEVRSEQFDLADLGPYGKANLQGRGFVSGVIEGPYDGLRVRGSTSMQRLQAQSFDLGTAAMRAEVDVEGEQLVVTEATVLKGASILRGRGATIEWRSEEPTIDARIETRAARLPDLVGIARTRWPSLQDVVDNLGGLADGDVVLTGAAAEPDATARFTLADVRTYGQEFTTGSLDLRVNRLTTYEVKKLLLRRGAGYFRFSGVTNVDDDTFEATAKTRKLVVGDIDPLIQRIPSLKGGVTLDVGAKGTYAKPDVTGTLTLRDWRLAGPRRDDGVVMDQPLFTARLSYGLEGRLARVSGTLATPWAEGVKPPPKGPNDPYPRPPGSMFHVLEGSVGLTGDYPFRFDAQVDIPDFTALARPDALGDLKGSLRGWAHLEGSGRDPLALNGQVRVNDLEVEKGRFSATNAGPMVVELVSGDMILRGVKLDGSGFELDVNGRREREGALDVDVDGRVSDLSFVQAFAGKSLERASGSAEMRVKVLGTLGAPEVVGTASVDRLSLRPKGSFAVLTDGSGLLEFSRNRVETRELAARVNGARVDLRGEAWNDDGWRARAEARTEPIPLDYDGMPLSVSGSPSVSWNERGDGRLRVGGQVELAKFRYDRDHDLQQLLVDLATFSRRPPQPQVLREDFIDLDVGLSLGDVRVDNNLAKAEFRGDLQLTGTNRRPGLLGAVTVVGGRAFLRNTEFRISSGVLNFTDTNRIRPRFDLRADAQVREYLVHVVASGTPQQPRLVLTSEPALSDADIVTLITLGVTQRDLDRGGGSLTTLLLEQAYDSLKLNDYVRKILPQTQIIKDASFRISSAYSELSGTFEPVATFEGKLFRDDVRVKGHSSLLGTRNRKVQMEVKFSDNVSGVVLWDFENPAARSTGDIGGDLKFTGEWQ